MKKTYTVKQVANALGFSTNTVYKYLLEGSIKATRLGKEGRFKIPESEVQRLLGKAPVKETSEILTPPTSVANDVNLLSDLNKKIPVDMFEWFLCLCGVFTSISLLINPVESSYLASSPANTIFKTSLVLSLLFSAMISIKQFVFPRSYQHIRLIVHLLLGIAQMTIATLLFFSNDSWTASYFATLSISAVYCVLGISPLSKFLIFFPLFLTITSIGYIPDPQPFTIIGDYSLYIEKNSIAFVVIILTTSSLLSYLIHRYSNRNQRTFNLLSVSLGLFLYLVTFSYINSSAWIRTIVCLLAGSFAILMPHIYSFSSSVVVKRRQALLSFAWIVFCLGVGVISVLLIREVTQNTIITSSIQKTSTIESSITGFVQDATRLVKETSSNKENIKLFDPNTKEDEVMETLRRTYLTSGTIKRIIITDSEYKILRSYPEIQPEALNAGFYYDSNELFVRSKESPETPIISSMISSPSIESKKSILITSPIFDSNQEYLGNVSILLDTKSLTDRINLDNSSKDGSNIYIIDENNAFIIHSDAQKIGEISSINATKQALNGASGHTISFDDNILSLKVYLPIKSLKWGLVWSSPYQAAFRQINNTSSLIFLLSVIAGTGTLFAFHFIKSND